MREPLVPRVTLRSRLGKCDEVNFGVAPLSEGLHRDPVVPKASRPPVHALRPPAAGCIQKENLVLGLKITIGRQVELGVWSYGHQILAEIVRLRISELSRCIQRFDQPRS